MRGELLEAERVHSIVAAFFTVFNYFGGGGMCEAAYKGALEYELTLRGHKVDREVAVPVYYKGKLVARQRLDIVVDDRVIVECKATERLPPSADSFAKIRAIRVPKTVGLPGDANRANESALLFDIPHRLREHPHLRGVARAARVFVQLTRELRQRAASRRA